VHTDRADGRLEMLALSGNNRSAVNHGEDPIGGLVWVLNERTLLTARNETAGLGIAAIGENLGNGGDARPIGCPDLFASRDRQQDQRGRDRSHGARNGIGDIRLDFREVAERAMRFDVSNAMTGVGRKRLRSTDLIGDKPFDFPGREGDAATAESLQVGKAGMCAHPYTPRLGNTEGMGHDLSITRMKAAGNIGRGHNREHCVVITATIGAETFTKIGIEIDRNHELALVLLDASDLHEQPSICKIRPTDPHFITDVGDAALFITLPVRGGGGPPLLDDSELTVLKISDQHTSRRVRDCEAWLCGRDDGLGGHAASPEDRQFIGADFDWIAVIGAAEILDSN
jgi:hypothetical protein